METLIKQKLSDIASSGHGIIEIKNQPNIYVLGAFPGDVIDVSIYKKLNKIWYGEIKKISKYSKYRETKPAGYPYFQANIPWASLSQKGEHKLRQKIFKDIYLKYKNKISKSKLNKSISNIGYRNKMTYAFIKDNNKLKFALYERGISDANKTNQDENLLVHPVLEETGNKFLDFLNEKNVQIDQIKYLILRYSYYTNSVVAHVLFPNKNESELPINKKQFEALQSRLDKLQGILVSYSDPEIRSASTEKDFYQIGDIDISEEVLNQKYYYHPSLFFQIYPKAFSEILLDIRRELEKIKNIDKYHVLDLFAGIGIIGISIADLVHKVTGVEHSKISKKYSLKNAEINNISNYDFIEDSVDNILNLIDSEQILIVDPVRSGLSKNICQKINEIKPEYIFYVSCNPETQIRDISMISGNYKISFIKQYNILPKTHHIESMVIFERN